MNQRDRRAAFWVAAYGAFVAADDLMVVSTMLRPIIDDLGLALPNDLSAVAWIVNAYLIAYIGVIPVAGHLSDRFGRRGVFVAALGVFSLGSIVVPATDSYTVLLAGRALSAIGGGALVPIALAVAGDVFEGPERPRAVGLLGAIETLGWVWGPLYGAVLVRFLSWQWQFYLNVPLAVVGMILGWRFLPGRRSTRAVAIDWPSLVVATVGLAALNAALLSGAQIQSASGLEELRGSTGPPVTAPVLYAIAAACAAALLWRHRQTLDALTPAALLARASPLVVSLLTGIALVIALVNVPLFINVVDGAAEVSIGGSALTAGWVLTALTVATAAGSVVGGRIGNYVLPVTLGVLLAIMGLLWAGQTWTASTSRPVMAAAVAVTGLGIGLTLAPTNTAVVDSVGSERIGAAASEVLLARLFGFSVGLAALTAWSTSRYEQLRASVELPPITDPGYQDAIVSAVVGITTAALAGTFTGAALLLLPALVVTFVGEGPRPRHEPRSMRR